MDASLCGRIAGVAALAALTLAARPAGAQEVTVSGRVADAVNGQPLAGAVVKVGDDRHSAITDAQGSFAVRGVRPGERTVWANALGYEMSAGPVTVGENGQEVELLLDPNPIRLAGITATVNRFEARRRAYARPVRVLTQDQIASSGAADMLDFVEGRAGLHRVQCGRGGGRNCVYFRGRAIVPTVWIDEARWPAGMDMLAFYRPWDVA
ncbi:MAG TPA: carboxypeptidase-like regulatory domain-containing protein, partial [Longimicrobium sp.]